MSMASKRYWEKHKQGYPYRVTVPHMSRQDINPVKFREMTREHFLRVPFDGTAYWGFKTEATRDIFLKAREMA